MVNLVNGRFPVTQRRQSIELPDALIKEMLPEGDFHLQEERRLFYVGMTRAKEKLILTHAKTRFLYGRTIENSPSRFLSDIETALKEMKKSEPYKKKKEKKEENTGQLGLF